MDELEWEPTVERKEGLGKTVEWFEERDVSISSFTHA